MSVRYAFMSCAGRGRATRPVSALCRNSFRRSD